MTQLSSILHVEDDADIREIARLALEMIGGLQVDQYAGGKAALDAAPSLTPDLLLLDQMMPEMSGEETLGKLREFDHLKTVPAIFMTAQTEDSSHALMARTDAIGFVTKPFDPMTLTDQLRDMLAEHDT
ncbi:Response regulator receiver domain-containing protein [Roseivivax halotolerans]|uniref:Response regulator receiver domain-containing protein n=1 Tax=Roseivivax halotolerans TaxID=93684 RepID=A0A1I5ZVB6_9RHOB|nr:MULTISPECIES: response regulator [Roseivivax]QFT62094.1 Phosphate regulon transcriptional regulatory protein PhoB [Roseivivax sp. THAF30]SFQ60352.1 Response regulator receiver domain-containing protein [Roseivivax halotolerans]